MKKKNMKKSVMRTTAMMMTAVMIIGIAGCGKKNTEGGADSTTASNAPGEKYTISYSGNWCDSTYEDDGYVETMIQDNIGADIKVIKQDNDDTLNLLLSSGEMPDCAWLGKTNTYMYDQGLARTIPLEMVKKYAPGIIETYENHPELYATTLNPENQEEFLSLVGITLQFVDYYLPNDYYRYDWIQDLGIDLGVNVEQISDNIYVADDGIELSKFTEIMEKFIKNDPNKNEIADTIGINGLNLTQGPFFSAYGFRSGINDVNGRAEQYYATPGYKEYLKGFADFYKRGLIDPQMITADAQISFERVNKEEAGYWITSVNALNSWAVDRPPLSLIEKHPEAKILMTPGIKPDGGEVMAATKASPAYGRFFVNAKVDDQKLIKILEFLQFCCFGNSKDTRASLYYGEKGVDWNWNEAGDMPIKINQLPSGKRGTWSFSQSWQDEEVTRWTSYEDVFAKGVKYWSKADNGSWLKWMKPPYKSDIEGKTDYTVLDTEHTADIDAYVANYTTECILGKKDVDATWDAYRAELKRLGYDALMDELAKLDPLEDVIATFGK